MKYRSLKDYKYENLNTESLATDIEDTAFIIPNVVRLWPDGELHVYRHYAWDGPSGPTFDTKTFMLGSLFHDALYQAMREGLLSAKMWRKEADKILRDVCLFEGMNRFRAWYVYKAVRFAGRWTCKPRKNPRGKVYEI